MNVLDCAALAATSVPPLSFAPLSEKTVPKPEGNAIIGGGGKDYGAASSCSSALLVLVGSVRRHHCLLE